MKNIRAKWLIFKNHFLEKKPKIQDVEALQLKALGRDNQIKTKQFLQIPKMQYNNFQKYLLQFYNSKQQHGRVNGQHITFVTGAQGIGKTEFIDSTLTKFRNLKIAKQRPPQITFIHSPQSYEDADKERVFENEYYMILKYDFGENPMMKEEALFHYFHERIIMEILRMCRKIESDRKMRLLDENIVLDIVLSYNAKQYIYMSMKDVVFSILENSDTIDIRNEERLAKLQSINEIMTDKEASQFFSDLTKQYSELLDIISEEYKSSKLQASIRLFLSIFKRIEFEGREQLYINDWYESGVQTTAYLFQVLDYMCGMGELNKLTVQSYFQKSNSDPNTQAKAIATLNNTFIGNGNHIDIVMILSNFEELTCYNSQRFWKWFDHIIARLHNSSNLRTHFPIVIEIADNFQLRQLQGHGRMLLENPTVMEIPGYFKTFMHYSNLPSIFSKKTITQLFPILGRNVSTWNKAITQLANGVPKQQIMAGNADYIRREKAIIEAKLNRSYLDPINLPHLDDNTLKYHMMSFLKMIVKTKGKMATTHPFNNLNFFDKDNFQSFYINKILFEHTYILSVDLVNHTDLFHMRDILNEYKRGNRFRFWLWRRKNRMYEFKKKQITHNQTYEVEIYKRNKFYTRRNEYHLRDYYGGIDDYKVLHYEVFLRGRYHV